MGTALVTGATSGIGNAFARRLAADGHQLVLVARDVPRLEQVAATLQAAHGVRVEVIGADLADADAVRRVAARLADPERPVDLLVNNAGFGLSGSLLETSVEDELQALDVMCRAVLVLTRAALPGMLARRRGAVITVSSVAGFLPGRTYSAVKGWATLFMQAVAAQVRGSGVHAVALCPGYVRTEFHRRARLEMGRVPSWLWLDADRVVAECLADLARGRVVSVPSRRYKVAVAVARRVPLRALSRGVGPVRGGHDTEG